MSDIYPLLRGVRVLFGDDVDFVQRGTAALLAETGLAVQVCGAAADLRHVLAAQPSGFDVVIVDLGGMGADFVPEQHVPELAQQYAPLPFVIFSGEDVGTAHYLDQGVRGYVSKQDGVSGLLLVLDAVLRGATAQCSPSVSLEARLARREREVLKLVANGLIAKQIALQLDISEHTVKEYYGRIKTKLDAKGMEHAVAIALRARLIR